LKPPQIDVAQAIKTWDKQKANFIQTLDLHFAAR
jgi:hypothetical protein